jgi:acetyltransferase-like isoleucine patch superfamily enzyme
MTRVWQLFGFRLRNPRWLAQLRISRYRFWGLKCGRNNSAGARLSITWPHAVRMGENCTIESNVIFKIDGPRSPEVRIKIGDRVFIGHSTELNIADYIEIGNDALIASGCRFIDHSHTISSFGDRAEKSPARKSIIIGDRVWIGANTVVLQGVHIGTHAVIGAGSVVNRSVPPGQTWGGVPARPLH